MLAIFVVLLIFVGIILATPHLIELTEKIILAAHARSQANKRLKEKGFARKIRRKIFKKAKGIRKAHFQRIAEENRAKRKKQNKGPGFP